MTSLLELILSFVIGEEASKRRWIRAATYASIGVGVMGLVGSAGHIPFDLDPLRTKLGGLGELIVHWQTLFVLAGLWFVALVPLTVYYRLSDSSVGKPD